MKVEIDIDVLVSALIEAQSIEHFADSKNSGKRGMGIDSGWLTISCKSCAIFQELIGYLDDDIKEKVYKLLKEKRGVEK